jgi:hypothetical protein
MQIRARERKRTTRLRSLLSVLLLSVPVVFIFLSSVLLGGDDLPSSTHAASVVVTNKTSVSSSTMDNPPNIAKLDRPTVYYDKVLKESNDSIHRYAAYVAEGPGTEHGRNILSIRRWAELMAHEDTEYSAALARNISSILKVRCRRNRNIVLHYSSPMMKRENGLLSHTAATYSFVCYRIFQESPFPAFRFETKGCHKANMQEKQFEFVLVNDSFLSSFAASADASAFADHFREDDDSAAAVAFSNLGNTAMLIAPQPLSTNLQPATTIYGHCGNFMRGATASQIAATWRLVAQSFLDRIESRDEQAVWLSTAGTGIAWLHFRLDDRPKYYQYPPFTKET